LPAFFNGASRDGRVAYITGKDLTDAATPGVTTLYRVDVDTQQLTLVAENVAAQDVHQVSSDGSYVYFTSRDDLAPGASASVPNIYVWHEGVITHVATLNPGRDAQSTTVWLASPNGRFFAFQAYSQLTDYDNASNACTNWSLGDPGDSCAQVYRYDAEKADLTCASCRPDGAPPTGNAIMGAPTPDLSRHLPRAVLDDGRVIFDTPDPLSSADVNSRRDVYTYDGEQTRLVSAGTGSGDSRIADVSSDGRDVFFTTEDQLVPRDTDTLNDVYDARIGGGFPPPDAPHAGCADEGCRATGSGPVSSPRQPSEETPANRFTPTQAGKAKLAVVSAAFRGTVLRLTVSVSGAGRIRASGRKVTATARSASKAGIYRLNVPLTNKQRALRRAGRKVKAAIAVSFTPGFGSHVTVKFTRTAAR
jgi:hypothetical protein